jgi:N-acetylglucosaminyldiphosphoundecaprenol N-acetyl-beta-D-mannosaminyltransferase
MPPRIEIGPTSLTVATMQTSLEFTDSLLQDHGNHFFCFCEASLLSSLILDPELARELRAADALFPDGIALLTLARLQGRALPERITGPSFLLAACQYGVSRGWRHFFYGGGPGVAEALAARLRRDYPGIIITGTCAPPFRPLTESEESVTKDMIESARPDLLWVCLGSPKQEYWCARHVGHLDVPLMLPVGAAFDFHSGNRPWAPAWLRKIGMEWAFRSITGGKRTLFRNLRCVSIVGAYLAKAALDYQFGKAGLSTRRVAMLLCVTTAVLVGYGLLTATAPSHAPSVLLLALLAFVCLFFGRMALSELRETGQGLLTGLRRPPRSLLAALTYPFWDAVGLAGALAIAMRAFEPARIGFWHSWFVDLPIWVTPTLCLLAV